VSTNHTRWNATLSYATPQAQIALSSACDANLSLALSLTYTRDQQINSIGTELMVFTKSSQGWWIRAIHWSSDVDKKSE
jgi:hypothetical protein